MPPEVKDKAAMADSPENDGATPQEPDNQSDDTDTDDEPSDAAKRTIQKLREEVKELKKERNAAAKAKAEADAKAKELEDAQLAEQGKYKELAETRADEILELKTKIVDIEAVTGERDQLNEALTKLVTSQFEGIPEDVAELVQERDILGQIAWLEKYGEKYRKSAGGRSIPPTPKPADESEASRKQLEEARLRDERRTRQQF